MENQIILIDLLNEEIITLFQMKFAFFSFNLLSKQILMHNLKQFLGSSNVDKLDRLDNIKFIEF